MASVKGFLTILSALVLCPCHLPILAAVLAGTALGSAITEHYGLLFPLTAIYFIGALFLGLRWLTRKDTPTEMPACGPCDRPVARLRGGESESQDAGIAVVRKPESNGAAAREPVGGRPWK